MHSTRPAVRRRCLRALVVGTVLAGTTALSAATATSASASSPAKLCRGYGGVAYVDRNVVVCGDGTEFNLRG